MRILVNNDNEIPSMKCVFQIKEAEYDAEMCGLYVLDHQDDAYYIPHINKVKCNDICLELLRYGFADLSSYNPIMEY